MLGGPPTPQLQAHTPSAAGLPACARLTALRGAAQSANQQDGVPEGAVERAAQLTENPTGEPRRAPEKSDAGRYPERNQLSGGWAGGETGLRKWVEARPCPCRTPRCQAAPQAPESGPALAAACTSEAQVV